MKYLATKTAKIAFTKEFEVEDAPSGFIQAEEDWRQTGGQGWKMGEAEFGPVGLEGAAQTVSVKRKPARDRVWAK